MQNLQLQNENEVAENSIHWAEHYRNKGLPGRSFAHFSVALKLKPEWKAKYQDSFFDVLCDFGLRLESEERYTDLFNSYEVALETFPQSEQILTHLGCHLCRLGFAKEARQYFKSALKSDADYLPAFRNLQSASNQLVEKWHYKMLNDSNRNSAFKRAISKKVKNGAKTVLDIGTGTGLLSLYAITEGAEKVYSCERSETMCSIAEEVFHENCLENQIKLLKKLSNNVVIPNDIPFRCSLVVTETVDCGLLGEGILQTLTHALDHLLAEKSRNIIPFKSKLYAAPIECLAIAKKYKIVQNERKNRSLSEIPFVHVIEGPYDLEYLKTLDFKLLSEPVEIFNIEFTDVKNMEDHLSGVKNLDVTFKCEKGFLDAFVVWFDLFLDEEIKISSSPFCTDYSCWGQAVFPYYSTVSLNNSSICTKISCTSGKLTINVDNINGLSNSKSVIEVSQSVIKCINSSSLTDFIQNCVQNVNTDAVLDLFPFPLGGILLSDKAQIFCINDSAETLKESIQKLALSDKIVIQSWDNCDFKDTTFDLIIVDLINTSGELCDIAFPRFLSARRLLKPEGIVIPHILTFWCQLIYCEQLSNEYEVLEANLEAENFKIARFINEYKTTSHIELDVRGLDYVPFSDRIPIGNLNLKNFNENEPNRFCVKLSVQKTGKINAILHGFTYKCGVDIYDPFSEDSHVSQTAEMLVDDLFVKENNNVEVCCLHQDGITKYSVLNS